MFLRELELTNFRSFSNSKLCFQQKLTVLVGENNGGKSNIIDAIRLLSTPLSDRRDIYCEHTDIRFGSKSREFEIGGTFSELSPPQQGRLLSAMTDETMYEASFGLRYDASGGQSHIRPILWAGRFKSTPEPGCHEMIRHVYLPPLRDAKRALASGNPTRIYALMGHFLGGRDPDEVAKSLARKSEDDILNSVDMAVGRGLDALTAGVRRQNAALGFSENEKLIDIARDLRFKLSDHGIAPEDLQYSGHGFANLLYIATIAVELEKVDNAELTLFLVEEPEAHLHPQLQAAVLNFLEERAEEALKPNGDLEAPAGHIQVIVATHSPNLSAWVSSKNLVFIRTVLPEAKPEPEEHEVTPTLQRTETRCIPLAELNLPEPDRRKIDRYLDVTKSALLFGGRVLLVEGIAEALLLPVIAKEYVLKNEPDKFRKFRSAVFVPIDGIDFEPYVKVLLNPFNGTRIADRVVIITDGDKTTVPAGQELPGNKRKADLEAIARQIGASEILDVVVNTFSLEAELVAVGNATIMKEVYLELHSQSEEKWDAAVNLTGDDRARDIKEIFKSTRKGDFAQLLAEKIRENDGFKVPEYIRQAIEAVVK